MLLNQTYTAIRGAGVDNPCFLTLDRASSLTPDLLDQLKGITKLVRDCAATWCGWCNRPAVEETLRRLLPVAGIDLPALPENHFYHVHVAPDRLDVQINSAQRTEENESVEVEGVHFFCALS